MKPYDARTLFQILLILDSGSTLAEIKAWVAREIRRELDSQMERTACMRPLSDLKKVRGDSPW